MSHVLDRLSDRAERHPNDLLILVSYLELLALWGAGVRICRPCPRELSTAVREELQATWVGRTFCLPPGDKAWDPLAIVSDILAKAKPNAFNIIISHDDAEVLYALGATIVQHRHDDQPHDVWMIWEGKRFKYSGAEPLRTAA